MLRTFRRDVEAVFERDPAARSVAEVVLWYPGLHAVWGYRFAHWLWAHGAKLLGRGVSHLTRFFTGIEIHPGATIGPGFFIDHGMGVVIGETTEIGTDVTLYHGVTLGGSSLEKGKRHPTLRDRVVVGAGAKIIGAIEVGADSRIGANAVVVKPVPEGSVIVGVPGHVAGRSHPEPVHHRLDFEHTRLPDTEAAAIRALAARVEALERRAGLSPDNHRVVVHAGDLWRVDDFSI